MLITIANKLKRNDSSTGLDVWYKTYVDAQKQSTKVQDVVGTEVSMGNSHTVLIPFSDKFVHYKEWVDGNKDETYTMSQDDVIFFDKVEEEITPTSIVQLKKTYEHCTVRSVEEREKKHGARIQLRVSGV